MRTSEKVVQRELSILGLLKLSPILIQSLVIVRNIIQAHWSTG